MTPIAGGAALNLAFGFSILTVISLIFYTRSGDQRLFWVGQRLSLAISFFVFMATFILSYQLMISNFDIDYVARYTSLETPTMYKISALWAGQSGSLLFWLFILSIFATTTVIQNQNKHHRLMPWVIITLAVIQMFFSRIDEFCNEPIYAYGCRFRCGQWEWTKPFIAECDHGHPPTNTLFGICGIFCTLCFCLFCINEQRYQFIVDSKYPALDIGGLAVSQYGYYLRWLVGLSRIRLGRLLGVGSRGECKLYAVAHCNSLCPLYHYPGKEGYA